MQRRQCNIRVILLDPSCISVLFDEGAFIIIAHIAQKNCAQIKINVSILKPNFFKRFAR